MGIYFKIIVSSLLLVAGWFVANYFAQRRDQINKRRGIRIEYLIGAYRDLGMATARPQNSPELAKLENAFHDVQLFGSEEQLLLLTKIFDRYAKQTVQISNYCSTAFA